MSRFTQKLKISYIHLRQYCRAIWINKRSRRRTRDLPRRTKSVLIDIRDYYSFEHYIFPFCLAFARAGYRVRIQNRYGHLCNISRPKYDLPFLALPGIELGGKIKSDLSFADYVSKDHILLTPDWYESRGNGTFKFPMTAHPDFYLNERDLERPISQNELRAFRVGFVGNASPQYYNSSDLQEIFACDSRYVCRQLLDAQRTLLESWAQDYGVLTHFHFCESHGVLPPDEYVALLDKIDFFLCLPGQGMPECHNIIESMSRACIPILAYPAGFAPRLEDGSNCIVYDGSAAGMLAAIQRALELTYAEVQQLRKNVVTYYRSHLDLAVVAETLATKYHSVNSVQIMAEWRSIAHQRKRKIG